MMSLEEMRRALIALRLEVPSAVSADVELIVWSHVENITASRDKLYESFCEMERERDAALRDLLRLCGPICPHEGKRAFEHTHLDRHRVTVLPRWICNRCEYGDHGGHLGNPRCDGRYGSGQIDAEGQSRGCDCIGIHPQAPEIEAWLEHSR